MPRPKGSGSAATLAAPSVTLTTIDLSAEDAADLTGASSVTLGGLTWTIENAASMTTLALDGTDGLDCTQAPNTDNTTATSADEVEIRIRRSAVASLADDLGVIVFGFRVSATPGAGYMSAFIRDAALSSPNPEQVRMQIGSIGADEYRCQDLSGGSATTGGSGSAVPLQAVLVIQGAYCAAYYSEDTTALTAADVESMLQGVAPSAGATWVLCQEGSFAADVIDSDAWVGLGIGSGQSGTLTVHEFYLATREASIA